MDTAGALALLLDRGVGGAGGRGNHETTSAILDEAACFAEAGWPETALLINPLSPRFDAAFDAVFAA
jgi:hypothetical protein